MNQDKKQKESVKTNDQKNKKDQERYQKQQDQRKRDQFPLEMTKMQTGQCGINFERMAQESDQYQEYQNIIKNALIKH